MSPSQPLNNWPPEQLVRINYLFADIDDTITTDGKLGAEAFQALWAAKEAGIQVIPVTGRPAGWSDHIARMWPVRGVIGENGGFYFVMKADKLHKFFLYNEQERAEFRRRLEVIGKEIHRRVPGSAPASDQLYREYDLAVDFREDVPELPRDQVLTIKAIFEEFGAQARISSIHVNGWFGDFNKLSTTRIFLERELKLPPERQQSECAFVGDSPNDEPMFAFFRNSVGVANIGDFRDLLRTEPAWVTSRRGGEGFAQLVRRMLWARKEAL